MALKSTRTQSQLLNDAVLEHIRLYGKDNKVLCYSYCRIADYIVGSFRLNENGEPEVVLANEKGELNILSARDFNIGECKAIQEAIRDNEDAINYRACCDSINRQTRLASDIEKSMKEYLRLTKTPDCQVARNNFPLEISGQKIVGYTFNPEKNKSLGGEYAINIENNARKRTEWIWNLNANVLELVSDNLKKNIEKISSAKTKTQTKGISR